MLSRHRGKLSLPKIVSLSEIQAEQLAKIPGNLDLTELQNISPAAEENLAKHTSHLHITNLEQITSPAFATKLATTSRNVELYRVARSRKNAYATSLKSRERSRWDSRA